MWLIPFLGWCWLASSQSGTSTSSNPSSIPTGGAFTNYFNFSQTIGMTTTATTTTTIPSSNTVANKVNVDSILETPQSILRSITSSFEGDVASPAEDIHRFSAQLYRQFKDPLRHSIKSNETTPGRMSEYNNISWLQSEFVLFLKGHVLLAHHSNNLRKLSLARGIRFVSPQVDSAPTPAMVRAIARSLSASVNANFLLLNRRTIEKIRQQHQQQQQQNLSDMGHDSFPTLTAERILSSLFEQLHGLKDNTLSSVEEEQSQKPSATTVVLIQEEMSWLQRVPGVSSLLAKELLHHHNQSNLFFILSEPSNDSDMLQTLPPPPPTTTTTSSKANNGFSIQPSPSTMTPELSPIGQSFQIIVRKDSATIKPIPPILPFLPPPSPSVATTAVPSTTVTSTTSETKPSPPTFTLPSSTTFPLPTMSGILPTGALPQPPEILLKLILEHHFQKLQQLQQLEQEPHLPFHHPLYRQRQMQLQQLQQQQRNGLTERDMELFMQEPENNRIMQEFLLDVRQLLHKQIASQLQLQQQQQQQQNSFLGKQKWEVPDVMEVKIHLMSSPIPAPPPPPTTTTKASAGEIQSQNALPTNATNTFRFPGRFFGHKPSHAHAHAHTHTKAFDQNISSSQEHQQYNHQQQPSQQQRQQQGTKKEKQLKYSDLLPSLFSDVLLLPPSDHTSKRGWSAIISNSQETLTAKKNRRLIERECRRQKLSLQLLQQPNTVSSKITKGTTILESASLADMLRRRVLTEVEVRATIHTARLFQAGITNYHNVGDQSSTDNNQTSKKHTLVMSDSIQLWALDAGLCHTFNLPIPGLPRRLSASLSTSSASSLSTSLEDVYSSITDKHERSLLANLVQPGEVDVSYDQIGGLQAVKQALQQCVTFPLRYPRLYQEGLASEGVKGVLLFGPPGTGKTMLAKAVATEGGATFLTVDASTIENKWLGESEKNAKAVFTLARKLAPCVIYLDEVDSLLSSRETGSDDSSHGTLTSVKTTLMQEWDGLKTTKDRVVVIASTNRPFDLDEAVLRRLPRRIFVDLPDEQTRLDILKVTLANNRLTTDVNLTEIAQRLEGYSGSDIKEVCREAVVRVSHERAMMEEGLSLPQLASEHEQNEMMVDFNTPLRAVGMIDFEAAIEKLKASVDETGRETSRVVEWNERFGEIKGSLRRQQRQRSRQHLSLFM